ncbi:endonuclease III [candidate division KSB1 bacterium]|nr:endonuclease III [candidate division KSB1 bacterium]
MSDRVSQILERLTARYPDAQIELRYQNPLELLVATILSAQCTDVRVNQVTPILFQKFKTPEDYLRAPIEELENTIRSTGFFRNKAKSIRGCCAKLLEMFEGQIPATMAELTTLPGVGRKTANVILGNAFGIPGMVVDTHVKRIATRLDLTQQTDPDKIEIDLCQIIPQARWTQTSHLFIFHGRRTCAARNPKCDTCSIYDLCHWPEKK